MNIGLWLVEKYLKIEKYPVTYQLGLPTVSGLGWHIQPCQPTNISR